MKHTLIFFVLCFSLISLGAQGRTHRLKEGETLFSVARQYGVTPELLQKINGISDPRRLYKDVLLMIPDSYTVQKGDTLYSLSKKLQIPLKTLLSWNGLTKDSKITIGQTLLVSSRSVTDIQEKPPEVQSNSLLPMTQKPIPTGDLFGSVGFKGKSEAFVAVSSGIILYKNHYRGLGQLLLIQGDDGLVYGYAGYNDSSRKVGEKVKKLDVLGQSGEGSDWSLRFFVFKGDRPLNPVNR